MNPYQYTPTEDDKPPKDYGIFYDAIMFFIPVLMLLKTFSAPFLVGQFIGFDHGFIPATIVILYILIVWPLAIRNIVVYFKDRNNVE